jgi:hypothetical protein
METLVGCIQSRIELHGQQIKKGHKTMDLSNLFIRENKYWFLKHTSIAPNLGIFEL